MMNKMFRTLAAFSLAGVSFAAAPASAANYLLDFDKAADGTQIASGARLTDQYASLGVSFALFENGNPVGMGALARSGFGRPTNAVWNLVGDVYEFSSDNRADILRISFANVVKDVSFLTRGDGDTTIFDAYDSAGNLLESLRNVTGTTAALAFTATGIRRIDARQNADDFTYSIDDLKFSDAGAVPEPASWAMMIGGVGAVGSAMRRRRRVASAVRYA